MNSGAECFFFFSINNGQNTWQMMTFLNSLNALIPKIPFSFFADFWIWVTSEARESSLGRILGVPSIEPFFGGGSLARGLYRTPPPHHLKAWLPQSLRHSSRGGLLRHPPTRIPPNTKVNVKQNDAGAFRAGLTTIGGEEGYRADPPPSPPLVR